MAETRRRYHLNVADDLSAAVEYYDGISADLGNRFRASVRKRLDAITDRPESAGRIHEQLRAAMVDEFPYVILYRHDDGVVFILGIFHASSDPEQWLTRAL